MLLLKRRVRKRRAMADRWNRRHSSAVCWCVLGGICVLAACCVAETKLLRKGADGRDAALLVAWELPSRSCSVQIRATRVFIRK